MKSQHTTHTHTELPVLMSASVALSTRRGSVDTLNERTMCEQNSTLMPTACHNNNNNNKSLVTSPTGTA